MNIFSNDDIDFSKDFYKYLHESHDKHVQEKKLKEKNNQIIKENIAKLEECIKNNLNHDNTQPFDKTFTCGHFKYLDKNNNYEKEKDKELNIKQFEKPMSKINLSGTKINNDDIEFISGFPVTGLYGTFKCKSNIIPKNTYTYLDNGQYLLIRMSNINDLSNNSSNESYDVNTRIYW